MLIIALAAVVYLVLGGHLASLNADFVQGIVMLGSITAMIAFVVSSKEVGGLTNGPVAPSGKDE